MIDDLPPGDRGMSAAGPEDSRRESATEADSKSADAKPREECQTAGWASCVSPLLGQE